MGIVASTLEPVAIRLAWICQSLLDPRFRKGEASTVEIAPAQPQRRDELSAEPEPRGILTKAPENNNSLHQENRNRRAAQFRYKTRPSSFDAALILRGKNKSTVVVAPTRSPLRRQNIRVWDVTSSSGCSSDSVSNSDCDSETELRVSETASNEEGSTKLGMSAEEEEAFRLTVGRGHFTRSKKDQFLNHLRLEKRLNELNNGYLALGRKARRHRSLHRRHSGDLHRIV